jgi:MFS family permease
MMIGVISGLFYGVAFAVRPFSGPLITKLNKKHIMLCAYAIGFLVNGGYAISTTLPMFVAARVLHGLQFAFIGSLTLTIASDSLPPEKIGSGVGLFGAGTAIATAIAPTLGLSLRTWGTATFTSALGERAGYTVVFAFAALCMLLSILPCALLPYKPLTKEQLASSGKWYSNIIAKEAVMPAIVLCFVCLSQILYTFYMEPFSREQGISNIGWFFTVYALGLLLSRPLSGRLLDKYGVAKVLYPACAIFASSFLVVGLGKSIETTLIGAVLAALGYGAAAPSLQTMCIKAVDPVRRGAASNTSYFGMDLGFWMGPTLGGVVIAQSSHATLYTFTVIPVVVAAAIFFIGSQLRRRREI